MLVRRRPYIFLWVLVYFVIANLMWLYLCTWKVAEHYVAQSILGLFVLFLALGAVALLFKCIWPGIRTRYDHSRQQFQSVAANVTSLAGVIDNDFHSKLSNTLANLERVEQRLTEMQRATQEEFQKLAEEATQIQQSVKQNFHDMFNGVEKTLTDINEKLSLDTLKTQVR